MELKYPPLYSNKMMQQHHERQVEDINEGNSSFMNDRITRADSIDREGILITAGTPWWRRERIG